MCMQNVYIYKRFEVRKIKYENIRINKKIVFGLANPCKENMLQRFRKINEQTIAVKFNTNK